jgi:uncharacterized protein
MDSAAIYFGRVMHQRLRPFRHRFVYRVFSVYLDIDKLDEIASGSRLFAHNRLNFFSFHDRDHGRRDGSALRPWIDGELRRAGLDMTGGRVMLLCFPRLFGYVFNPLSVFYCFTASGQLGAVLYEVKNTFGEQHCYLLGVPPRHSVSRWVDQEVDKRFYVSPFIDMQATYRFRLSEPDNRLSLTIRERGPEGELLIAMQHGIRRPFSDAVLLRALVLYPLMTVKIIAGIHWQALQLWRRGEPVRAHTAAPPESVTVSVTPRPARSP